MEFVDLILVPKVDNVVLTDRSDQTDKNSSLEATLCITGHHLILSSRQAVSQELWVMILDPQSTLDNFYLLFDHVFSTFQTVEILCSTIVFKQTIN